MLRAFGNMAVRRVGLTSLSLLLGAAGMRSGVDVEVRRHDHELAQAQGIAANATRKDFCKYWLVVEYNDGTTTDEVKGVLGSFRYEENKWQNKLLMSKTLADGCTKDYMVSCTSGDLTVETNCPDQAPTSETRCLGGLTDLCANPKGVRESSVGEGESIDISRPGGGSVRITSGGVKIWPVDPAKGIDLENAPGYGSWKTEVGCYCCKTDWGALENPFSMSSRRAAWKSKDGTMECMLAWRMIGNGLNHEEPVETSAAGIFLMIPEAVITFADIITGTIGRHIACAATCPMRKAKYENNQYAYTKIQTDMDKY